MLGSFAIFYQEQLMSMSLSNLVISTKAPANTIIGQLALYDQSGTNMSARFQLTKNSAGYFVNSGNSLMTSRASIAPGYYSVRVRGVAQMERWKEDSIFVIQVTST
jgi:hypothetical protein